MVPRLRKGNWPVLSRFGGQALLGPAECAAIETLDVVVAQRLEDQHAGDGHVAPETRGYNGRVEVGR